MYAAEFHPGSKSSFIHRFIDIIEALCKHQTNIFSIVFFIDRCSFLTFPRLLTPPATFRIEFRALYCRNALYILLSRLDIKYNCIHDQSLRRRFVPRALTTSVAISEVKVLKLLEELRRSQTFLVEDKGSPPRLCSNVPFFSLARQLFIAPGKSVQPFHHCSWLFFG